MAKLPYDIYYIHVSWFLMITRSTHSSCSAWWSKSLSTSVQTLGVLATDRLALGNFCHAMS